MLPFRGLTDCLYSSGFFHPSNPQANPQFKHYEVFNPEKPHENKYYTRQ